MYVCMYFNNNKMMCQTELLSRLLVWGYVNVYSGVSKDRRAEIGVSILIKKKFKKGITNW